MYSGVLVPQPGIRNHLLQRKAFLMLTGVPGLHCDVNKTALHCNANETAVITKQSRCITHIPIHTHTYPTHTNRCNDNQPKKKENTTPIHSSLQAVQLFNHIHTTPHEYTCMDICTYPRNGNQPKKKNEQLKIEVSTQGFLRIDCRILFLSNSSHIVPVHSKASRAKIQVHFYAHAMRTRITQVHPQDPSALSKCIPTWSNGVHFGHDGSLVSWECA